MKIAIDLTSLSGNLSGLERFADNIAYYLIRNNQKDHFILIFQKRIPPHFQELIPRGNISPIVLPRRNKLWFRLFTLPVKLYQIKADRWLFPAFPPPLLFIQKGVISAIHDLCCWDRPETMTVIGRFRFRLLFRKTRLCKNRIITVSEFSRERIHRFLHIPYDKITVVHNGVDERFFRWKEREDEIANIRKKYCLPEKFILCLSTVEPRKNISLLIRACSELWKENDLEPDLVIAGKKGWKTQPILEGIPEVSRHRISFTGFISDDDLPLLYHMAELFVFPSIYEGFGIPPLEALASGTAVISSDAEAMKEILGSDAIFFENNNLSDLKVKIKHAINTKPIGDPAAAKKYTWSSAAEMIEKVLSI